MKEQERELMEARSLPLRNYLMKYVMPSLSQAMLDCCAQKPEDPIDYLVRPSRPRGVFCNAPQTVGEWLEPQSQNLSKPNPRSAWGWIVPPHVSC